MMRIRMIHPERRRGDEADMTQPGPGRRAMLLACLVLAATPIRAHDNEAHGKKAASAEKEQKAWGVAGDARAAGRTVELRMSDKMRFTPDSLEVKQGQTIRFILHNDGRQMHEFVLGTRKELDEHAALMLKYPKMEHDEPYMAHVGPGKTGMIIWTFNRTGEFEFACLIPGHYQAGMTGKIRVSAR